MRQRCVVLTKFNVETFNFNFIGLLNGSEHFIVYYFPLPTYKSARSCQDKTRPSTSEN